MFKHQLPECLGGSASGIELIVIAVQGFRPVQGSARTFQQCDRIFRVIWTKTDADTRGEKQFLLIEIKWRTQGFLNVSGYPGSVVGVIDLRLQKSEVVATKTGDGVAFTHCSNYSFGDLAQ